MIRLYQMYLKLLMATAPSRLFCTLMTNAWYFAVLKDWVGTLSLGPGEKILEAGCGPGLLTMHLAESGMSVTGLDRSPQMVRTARRIATSARSSASFVCASIEDTGSNDHSYDHVIAASLLNVVDRQEAVLKEIGRITRPGGQTAFLVPPNGMTQEAVIRYAEHEQLGSFARAILFTWQKQVTKADLDSIVSLMDECGYNEVKGSAMLGGLLTNITAKVGLGGES